MLQAPTPEQARVVNREINNTYPEKLEEYVSQLKEWMESQPHMPRNYDERVLPRMVVGTKYDINRAKRKLEAYYSARANMPEIFAQRDPTSPEIQTSIRAMSILPLAKCRQDGARVTLHIVNDVDSADHEPQNMYKLITMMADIRLVEEPQISGDVFVFDAKYLSLGAMLRYASPSLKSILSLAQDAYPQRLKEIHLINAPSFVARGINFFRTFMKEKMRNRFVVHPNLESLHKVVPKDILPVEYGGSGKKKKVQQIEDQWLKTLESYASYFVQQQGVKTDDSRRSSRGDRSNNRCYTQDLHSTHGSFRQLSLD